MSAKFRKRHSLPVEMTEQTRSNEVGHVLYYTYNRHNIWSHMFAQGADNYRCETNLENILDPFRVKLSHVTNVKRHIYAVIYELDY